jgi:hypothetical protein
MGLPVAGSWYTRYANASAYTGAERWGTGNNPIHEVYGTGPPLRTTGREPGPDYPTPELSDTPSSIETAYQYGYTMDDIESLTPNAFSPAWGTETDEFRNSAGDFPGPWQIVENFPLPGEPAGQAFRGEAEFGAPGSAGNIGRYGEEVLQPDPRLWSGIALKSFPTESVTEGWKNKETGAVADARTSDPSQYERQTSMQQVNPAPGRNNDAAVLRATDDARFNIMTRLTGQKIKPWSQGQRNIDMFPYQQDLIVRPFWYRTGATDDPSKMDPNEMYVIEPIQRDVPPDPYLGPEETNIYSLESNGGYTDEDYVYG